MADEELPIPESRQDELLHNIADGTPDISELVPQSREEVYLKYIALNGGGGGGGVTVVQTTGQSTTSVMSQKAVTDNLDQKVNTVDGKGLSTEDFTTEEKEKLNNIPNNLDQLGTAAYCDTGTSEGNVPIINAQGKLDNSVIPSLAITDTFVAENEDEMLNLPGAEKGDICIRTDESKTYILDEEPNIHTRALTRTVLGDWVELQTPTSEVTSVNGEKGDVTLTIPTVVQARGTSTTDVMSQKAVTDSLATKVDSVDGKGLSTEDFTTEEKEKLANIPDEIPQINIVQTTGTSTTDVMSQKAVSENVCFGSGASVDADSTSSGIAIGQGANASDSGISIGNIAKSTKAQCISIGRDANSSQTACICIGFGATASASNSISIGQGAMATGAYSVSIGTNSTASDPSVVSVGDGSTNANYGTRRIVNVKDPVNAQDASTKKYVDDSIAGISTPTIVQVTGTSETDVMSQKAVTDSLATKVDAEEGKGLSTEDFTTEEKEKLANIPDEIPEVNIVQTTGTSTTDVMSQKAVSENTCFGEGASAEASGVAIGPQTISSASTSVAICSKAKATAGGALAIGEQTQATNSGASAFGGRSQALGLHSLTLGSMSKAIADYSVALGYNSKSDEEYTVSVGSGQATNGTRRIVNVGDPEGEHDATTKNYVDNKSKKFTATVATTWTQAETGEYTQEVEIEGILEADTPIVDVVLSDDLDTAKALIEAWSCVSRISTLDGEIKLYCYETAPTVEIPISLICIR